MQAVLDAMTGKSIDGLTAVEARKQPTPADAVKIVMTKKLGKLPIADAMMKVEDKTYGPNHNAVRIYTPKGIGPFPVVLYFHGGGWVIGTIDAYDASPRAIANASGAIVVAASYRQAPENKFPTAHDDAFVAYMWTIANAASFGGDATRIAIVGESAGGNLAFDTAIRARDEKVQTPVQLTLIYPIAGSDMTTASYVTNEFAKPLSKAMMMWFVDNVFASKADAKDPRIDLVSRIDLAGLPPTTVITAEIDPLRSEGMKLAANLKAAGIKVDAIDYKGVTHEFFGMGVAVAKAKLAEQAVGKDLKTAFANTKKVAAK